MKYYLSIIIAIISISCVSKKIESSKTVAQTPKSNHEVFEYQEGDTTYVMQKYFLVLLKKGPNRNQSQEEATEIQKRHLEHLAWLDKLGKVSIVGPSEGHDTIAGFVLFNTETIKEADSLAHLDPAVKAGRLEVEVLPWWAAKGSKLK
jgi:uncharacterized protein YciI